MNIEESKSLLSWVSLNKLYIDTHNECDYHNIHTAIEALLTAYEKEKEKNKKAIDFINDNNNYFEDGENWQNILKIKEILEE